MSNNFRVTSQVVLQIYIYIYTGKLTKLVATLSGNAAAIIVNEAVIRAAAPKPSKILTKKARAMYVLPAGT